MRIKINNIFMNGDRPDSTLEITLSGTKFQMAKFVAPADYGDRDNHSFTLVPNGKPIQWHDTKYTGIIIQSEDGKDISPRFIEELVCNAMYYGGITSSNNLCSTVERSGMSFPEAFSDPLVSPVDWNIEIIGASSEGTSVEILPDLL